MLSAALSRLSLSSRPRLFALLSALSPAAGSWRRCGRFLAVSWGKRCVCVLSCSGSFSASRVMWRIASGDGFPYRADGVGGSSCLLFIGSRVPLPLGAGDYVRPAGFGLVCGEGVGVFSRFSYFSACRRVISSSLVVIALGLLASLPSSSSHHAALPCSSRSCGSPRLCVSLSYRSSPRSFDEPGGAFFACLPRSLSNGGNAPPYRVDERGAGTSRRTRDETSDGTTGRDEERDDEQRASGNGARRQDGDETEQRRRGYERGRRHGSIFSPLSSLARPPLPCSPRSACLK